MRVRFRFTMLGAALLLIGPLMARAMEETPPATDIVIRSGPDGRIESQGPARLTRRQATSLSRDSVAYRDARRVLPHSFRPFETRRFVVLTNTDPDWAQSQLELLERTYHQYQRFVDRQGLPREPLRHKLVCVIFRDRSAYQTFARAHDSVRDPWIAGYYAPASQRTVFYHGASNPSLVDARTRLAEMAVDLDTIRDEVNAAQVAGNAEQATALAAHRDRYEDHLQNEHRRVEDFQRQVEIATTVHETVHQLAFHTGLQSAEHQYPLWISEGLATCFETDAPDRPFGPDRDYDVRRSAFDALLDTDDLIPLLTLVTATRMPGNDDWTVHRFYHQSYALFSWLARYHRRELATYFELLRNGPSGRLTADQARDAFVKAFGDHDRLERTWRRSERARYAETVVQAE